VHKQSVNSNGSVRCTLVSRLTQMSLINAELCKFSVDVKQEWLSVYKKTVLGRQKRSILEKLCNLSFERANKTGIALNSSVQMVFAL
jgi:hypothetical protein